MAAAKQRNHDADMGPMPMAMPSAAGPRKRRRNGKWWIIGGAIVILIALVAWFGSQREEEISRAIYGTSVLVVDPSANAATGTPLPFTWEVRAPVGALTIHTAIHWGTESHPQALGLDVAPSTAGYPERIPDYDVGQYALPRRFEGVVTFPTPQTYYYRAHAVIDGQHYWSPEYEIVVE